MSELVLNNSSKFSGRFKIVKKIGDTITHDNGWQDNLITDAGLKALAAGTFKNSQARNVHLSSNSDVPTVEDVTITNSVGVGNTESESPLQFSSLNREGNYYYTKSTLSYKVTKGNNYIVSKIHLAANSNSTAVPFTSALIKDLLGNPTTIAVLPEEDLYVEYELRQYFELVEEVNAITISVRGIDKSFTIRSKPYALGQLEWKKAIPHFNSDVGRSWADNQSLRFTVIDGYPDTFTSSKNFVENFPDYNQNTGEHGSYTYQAASPYSRRFYQKIKPNGGNYEDGIKYFSVSSCRGVYVFEVLDANGKGIPKTKNDELVIVFNTTVGRYEL